MSKSKYILIAPVIVLIFAALACIGDVSPAEVLVSWLESGPSPTPEENPLVVEFETEMAKLFGEDYKDKTVESTPVPPPTATSEIVISEVQRDEGLRPREGTCAWVLSSNSDGYPLGWVNDDMRVFEGDIESSLRTKFWHGKPGCNDQVFETYHGWGLEKIYYPTKTYDMIVVFIYENIGTADCSSLAIAGGVTSLSVDQDSFQVKAQRSNINIRKYPSGTITDDDQWTPPEGEVGDILTITQHFNTGSYGKNIRWRYEYVCE